MSKKISRRDFIKTTTAAGGAAARELRAPAPHPPWLGAGGLSPQAPLRAPRGLARGDSPRVGFAHPRG